MFCAGVYKGGERVLNREPIKTQFTWVHLSDVIQEEQ